MDFERLPAPGDGSCFFHALLMVLIFIGEDMNSLMGSEGMRSYCCDVLKYDADHPMRLSNTWANDEIMRAAADLYNVNIHVIHANGREPKWVFTPGLTVLGVAMGLPNSETEDVYLLHTGNHFDALVGLQD